MNTSTVIDMNQYFSNSRGLSGRVFEPPLHRWYLRWEKFLLLWAVYSSFFTPMEFGFFRGLPRNLLFFDITGQMVFLLDIFLQLFVSYKDSTNKTCRIFCAQNPLAMSYLKSYFILDFLGCMPLDIIYKAIGRKEVVRYLLWIRLVRVRKLTKFFQMMEKDIRVNYHFARILKLIAVELYWTHAAACILYYLATTVPPEQEEYTWIGSLRLGGFAYSSFREIGLWKRYTTSLYFAIVTMATVGYGDIHAVNVREMIFIMIYISSDMILGAYLIGNMTALIVKGSKTEKYRDKMNDLMKFSYRNRLSRDIRIEIKDHLRLQYKSSYTDDSVIQDLPSSIRAKISQSLYMSCIENVDLLKGCSTEFINQIVSLLDQPGDRIGLVVTRATRVHEEFFLPGEVIIEQGNVVDQIYFVCNGVLEEIGTAKDGFEELVSLLDTYSTFGITSVLCNIPQPNTIRVCEMCRLLRIDKQSFTNILEIYFHDRRKILTNLLKGKGSNFRLKQLGVDISFHIEKQEAELALKVNNAAYNGDMQQLKNLIRSGADPNKKDYDGRSPLHLAASRGFVDIVQILIQEGVDINVLDNFGNTPFFEAIKSGNEGVSSLLVKAGALVHIENSGNFLCMVVNKGDTDLLRRLLAYGVDPNCRDYDQRSPLHVAASQGLYLMVKLLLDSGANIFSKDRMGKTALDEARICGNKSLINLLEEAKVTKLSECSNHSETKESNSSEQWLMTDKARLRKCTVFPYDPWETKSKEGGKCGVVLWVPYCIEELIREALMHLNFVTSSSCCILTEDGGKILDVDLISDGQRLYLTRNETQ